MFFKLVKNATKGAMKEAKDNVVKLRKELGVEKDKLKKIEEGPFKGTSGKRKQAANKKAKIKDVQSDLNKQLAEIKKATPEPRGKATQKGVRFKKKAELQEGMALDPITGRGVRAASDVDKGKAGKVTRSPEPGFLQSQRTAGSRAKAKEKVELARKVREGEATKADKDKLKRLRQQDELDTVRAQTKGAQTRRGTKKPVDDFATAINRKTGEINEAAFNRLTKNQQQALIRDIRARFSTTRAREIQARIDELEPTKAGETGVRRRTGGPKGMRGATERNIKDIDEGVSRGRGGLDFRKGGKVTKRAIGAHDFRMNKGGLLLSSVDNRKRK
tara:strand:- start:336 stop:1328 length:993 start_codon:yes stop_codon:yes gene_type:complete